MIIGSRNVNLQYLMKLKEDTVGIYQYCESLVPEIYKHNRLIINNQKYYVYTCILEDISISKEDKLRLIEILLKDIKICGFIDSFMELSQVEELINKDKVELYYRKELYDGTNN